MSSSKSLTSPPSIEEMVLRNDRPLQKNHNEYIINLEKQVDYQKTALITAENLIQTYRIQNQYLISQKEKLLYALKEANRKVNVLQTALANSNYHQKSLLQLSDQITCLLEKQTMYENKTQQMSSQIHQLEKALAEKQKLRLTSTIDDHKKEFINRDTYNFTKIINNRRPIPLPVEERVRNIRVNTNTQDSRKRQQNIHNILKQSWGVFHHDHEKPFSKRNYHSTRVKTTNTTIDHSRDKKHKNIENYSSLNRYGKSGSLRR